MRSVVSALAVILSLLLTGVAVPMAWTNQNVVREDGFVALTAPLGKDQAFQSRLAAAAVGSLESKVDLPGPAEQVGASLLKNAATSMTTWPEYPQAWNDTVRQSHRLNFGGGAAAGQANASTSLVLDVGPLTALVAKRLASTTGIPVTPPESVPINIGGPTQRQQVDSVAAYAPLWWVSALGAVLLFALALLLARRRGAVVLFTGLGLAAVAGLWGALSTIAKGAGDVGFGGTAAGALFVKQLVAAAVSDFSSWIVTAAVAGGVLAVLGVLILILAPKERRSAS